MLAVPGAGGPAGGGSGRHRRRRQRQPLTGDPTPPGYDRHAVARRAVEPDKAAVTGRTPFERDRARVLHSAALRRLAAKTQVVGVGVADFPRTRLTHSLECAQIGRELARSLGTDPDVVDAACLAHDLGHPPFGHNGEAALDAVAADCGGFEGNAQSLRVLTRLEAKSVDADGRSVGLNLTRAVLDAATKYPWARREGQPKYGVYADDRPAFDWLRDGAPPTARCVEARLMDWADDVAYSVHDLEDGVVGGHVPLAGLGADQARAGIVAAAAGYAPDVDAGGLADGLERLLAAPWWPTGFDGGHADLVALKRMTSELIARFVAAAVRATRKRHGLGPLSRYAGDLVVPGPARVECAVLKGVTAHYVMSRSGVVSAQRKERDMISTLVDRLVAGGGAGMEPSFAEFYHEAADEAGRLRAVVDQVASLTDTSARAWYARLVDR